MKSVKSLNSTAISSLSKRYISVELATTASTINLKTKQRKQLKKLNKKVVNNTYNVQSVRLFNTSNIRLNSNNNKDDPNNTNNSKKVEEDESKKQLKSEPEITATGRRIFNEPTNNNSSENNNEDNGNEEHDSDDNQSTYPPVLAIRIYKQPLLPGLAKPLAITDPDIIESLKKSIEKNQFYVSVFLNKSKNLDGKSKVSSKLPDRFLSADDVHEVGTICEISHVYQGIEGRSTLLLYPHHRVKLSEVVNVPELKEGSLAEEISKLKEQEQNGISVSLGETEEDPSEPTAFLMKENVTVAKVSVLKDLPCESTPSIRALTSEILKLLKKCATVNHSLKDDISALAEALESLTSDQDKHPGRIADFAANITASTPEQIQEVLNELDIEKRLLKALELVKQEMMTAELQLKLSEEMNERIKKRQHETLLYDQMKAIKAELGIDDGKPKIIEELIAKGAKLTMPEHVKKIFDDEIKKLKSMESSSDFTQTRNYLDWIVSLPWNKYSKDQFNIQKARKILDAKHYGMQDVKDRILEFIAISKLQGKSKGQIICLVGPPGVGKTSIGKCIAESLNRKFHRFAVGGLSDVAEIKGHRRTYIGALPGRFIEGLKLAKTMNPLIMIDEIDKISSNGIHGSPTSALLEVLDPEQNDSFLDHYMDMPINFSKVLFICTANSLDTIPKPLLDRMEVIEVSGYTEYEKLEIAKRYIEPASKEKHGLKDANVSIEEEGLIQLLKGYCRESGVRNLKNHIDKIYRKLAFKIVEETATEEPETTTEKTAKESSNENSNTETVEKLSEENIDEKVKSLANAAEEKENAIPGKVIPDDNKKEDNIEIVEGDENASAAKFVIPDNFVRTVKAGELKDYVGLPYFTKDRVYDQPPVGVIPGLAAGSLGGSMLYVESCITKPLIHSESGSHHATGHLMEVIKESTNIAYSFTKMFIAKKFPNNQFFEKANIHTHFPAGAVPKDGPSAGVTIVTSLISLALNKPIINTVAMTGEISLTGKVGAIGGLKEKTMAAKRGGMKQIIFPKDCLSEWEKMPDIVKEGIEPIPVDYYSEIYDKLFGEVTENEGNNVWKKDFDIIEKKKKKQTS
ncbi:hypothetical protein ACO0SA_004030 [Hanseniaspora valbyensis]